MITKKRIAKIWLSLFALGCVSGIIYWLYGAFLSDPKAFCGIFGTFFVFGMTFWSCIQLFDR